MYKEISGQKFNFLTAISVAGRKSSNGCVYWLCQCDCGRFVEVLSSRLRSGETKSCGCWHKKESRRRMAKMNLTHGKSGTRLHRIWNSMKTRCLNENSKSYRFYGGRGIGICKEWVESFMSFYEWAVSNGYSDDLTIDRIDPLKDYCPQNCQWISIQEQQKNRRDSKKYKISGKEYCRAEAAILIGCKYSELRYKEENFYKENMDI